MTQAYETSQPVLCCDSPICKNSSNPLRLNEQSLGDALSSQDDELLRILEDLQNKKLVNNNPNCSDDTRIRGLFLFGYYLQLKSKGALQRWIKFLEKELHFAPSQNEVNETELRKDFDKFCRRMRMK